MTSHVILLMMTKAIEQDHYRMLLKEARISSALKASRNENHRYEGRLLMRMGDLLVAAGCKLRERAMPPVYSSSEARHSGC